MKNIIFKLFALLLTLQSLVIINNSAAQNQDYDEVMTMTNGYNPPSSPYVVSGTWNLLANSPMSVSRSCCVYVEINGTPYLYQFGGGDGSSSMRRVARLNLHTNVWQNNYSTMPHEMSSATAVATSDYGTVYVFGGNNSPGTLGKTLKYNVQSNTWQTMSDMPTRVTDALVVRHNDHRIIVIGGGDGYFGSNSFKSNKVQVYDVQTNSYSYNTDFPIPCSMLGGGIYRDTIIAVGGYTTGGNATANCYKGRINPTTGIITWTTIPSYPGGAITRLASHLAIRNLGAGIMCTGGAIGGSVPTSQTHFWNFCTQSWQSGLPTNSMPRSNYKASGNGAHLIYTTAGLTTVLGVGTTEYISFSTIEGPCHSLVGINNNNSTPEKFELQQNYPNPFNPQTKISFALPVSGMVKIVVTDMKGSEVKELTNRLYQSGSHSIDFVANELSSGIYFYTITTAGFTDTKKMLLIK